MKRIRPRLSALDLWLIAGVIFFAAIWSILLVTVSSPTTPSPTNRGPVVLGSGSFNQPSDIQGTATGLQPAQSLTPSGLQQLNLQRSQ